MKTRQGFFTFFLCLASIAGAALRIVQFKFAIEPQTGFYKTESLSVFSLNIIIFVVFILFLLGFFIIRKDDIKNTYPLLIRFGSLSKFSISLLLVLCCGQALISLTELVDSLSKGEYIKLFEVAFILVFIVFLINMFRYKDDFAKSPSFELLLLAPLCWNLIRLIGTFIKYTGIANISARLFEIIMLAFFVLFFLSYAKAATGKSNKRAMFIFGICAIFSTCLAILPQFILYIKPDDVSSFSFLFNQILDLSLAVFIANVIFTKDGEQLEELEDYDEFQDEEDE